MHYALVNWQQTTDPESGETYRHAPDGTLGLVDLSAHAAGSYVFVTRDTAYPAGKNTIPLGDGTKLDSYALTTSEEAAWEDALGVAPPKGSLLDALWRVLTVDADATHTLRAKPILPTHRGVLELHLGGHSRIKQRAWRGAADEAAGPILAVVRADYRRTVAEAEAQAAAYRGAREGDALYESIEREAAKGVSIEASRELLASACEEHALKVLGGLKKLYRVETDLLVDADLREDWGAAREPTTTIEDDFNRATLGADWTVVDGSWGIHNSAELERGNAASTYPAAVRHNTLLSSADHYAQIDATYYANDSAFMAPLVRCASSGKTWYESIDREGGGLRAIIRREAGSGTTLVSDTGGTAAPTDDIRLTCDGSTIRLSYGTAAAVLSATDTTITGNVRVGVNAHNYSASVSRGDNFVAEDLVAAAPGRPWAPPFSQPISQGF